MMLIFGSHTAPDGSIIITIPNYDNTRGRWSIRNLYWNAIPSQKKITIQEAIDILVSGWAK